MTAEMAAVDTANDGAANRPATTRVTILTGRRITDLVLPAAAPIESYIDDAVTALEEILQDSPKDALAGFDFNAQGEWVFARPGAPAIKSDQSLDDAGVVDGTLLTLATVSRTERYRPLVEDIIDAVAVLDESPEFDRSSLNLFAAVAIPVVTAVITLLAVLAWARTGHSIWWLPPVALGAIGLIVGSLIAKNSYRNLTLSESLLLAAYPALAGALILAVPLPREATGVGAPQYAAAAAGLSLLTLATWGGPRKRAQLAAFTVVLTIAAALAAIAFGFGWDDWVPAGAIAFGLFIVTNAAKLTVAVARIALPPIPAPGEDVSHEDLLDPVVTPDAGSEETSTWRAIVESVPDSAVRLTERTRLAKDLLVGFISAGTLVLTIGAISVPVQGHFFLHSLIVSGLVTVLCGFRSRLFAERWCAWALQAAAVAIPLGVGYRLCSWYPGSAWLILTILVAVAGITMATIGSTAGTRRVSPVTKRLLELADGAVIAAIIPLLLWISGVYDILRNIRF